MEFFSNHRVKDVNCGQDYVIVLTEDSIFSFGKGGFTLGLEFNWDEPQDQG